MTISHHVLRTNPRSKWPYRIVRITEWPGGKKHRHKLAIKFATADAAARYVEKHGPMLVTFA